MKFKTYALASILVLGSATQAIAAGVVGQCLSPKKVPVRIEVFNSTSDKAPSRYITTLEAFTVKAKGERGLVQLATVPDYDKPNPTASAGKIVGWAKLSDFDLQDLRNCN